MRKPIDTLIRVVHAQRHAGPLEVIHLHLGRLASIRRGECQRQLAGTLSDVVGGAVLVAESVTTNDDGFRPAWDGARDGGEDDGFAEDCAA